MQAIPASAPFIALQLLHHSSKTADYLTLTLIKGDRIYDYP